MKTGILLLNVGTPKELSLPSVKKYLAAFLGDPYVIEGSALFRWMIVKFVVPFRAPRTLEKYRKIWTERGSPLAFNSKDLEAALSRELGEEFVVRTGFGLGCYPIVEAVDEMRRLGCDRICLVPLFPQRAESTTDNVLEAGKAATKGFSTVLSTPEFFKEPWHARAWAQLIQKTVSVGQCDRLLMSYHGLPIAKAGVYQPQCYATSEAIVRELGWPGEKVVTCFQSRFGPLKWTGPSTLTVLKDLAAQGVRRVAVACPAFVVDGLESLEEVGIELKNIFVNAGGESLALVPCLNADPLWVTGLAQWVRAHCMGGDSYAGKTPASPAAL